MERFDEQIELDEYDIVQNHILGAHIIREFVRFYQNNSEDNKGPTLVLIMPLLPLVLNKEARSSISNRRFIEGSLVKTILEEKTLYAGLQERMEKMAGQTFQSLSIAFWMQLIDYDVESTRLRMKFSKNPKSELESAKNYKEMLGASRRLGTWFAKLTFEELITVLKINF
ncbi:MAG: hypothetical protein CL843_04605 [Crocinitomicaceae bacterium]|nr:hypothetical protein [Crocinitomicaceae bacterium]|tara:strand:+ start:31 stop:540 length:510 start_codon:yes stop_codon:yes gene_type:complete